MTSTINIQVVQNSGRIVDAKQVKAAFVGLIFLAIIVIPSYAEAPQYRTYAPNVVTATSGTPTGNIDDVASLDSLYYSVEEVNGDSFTLTSTADFDDSTKTDTATETDLDNVAGSQLQKDVYGPEGDIVLQAVGVSDATVGDVGDAEYWRGQSFNEPFAGYLTSVLFFYELDENSPNNVSVHLYSDDSTGLPDTELSQTNNLSSSLLWGNHIGAVNRFKIFNFTKPYLLTANTKYHVILQTEGDSPTGGRYIFSFEGTNVYDNGDWISSTDGGSSWSKNTGFDMKLIIRCKDYGGEEVQATLYPVSEDEQSPVSAVLGDKAYNNGGGTPTANGWKWYEYNPSTDTFAQLADIPNGTSNKPRHAGMATTDGTYIYFIGGSHTVQNFVPFNHRYNVATDSWNWMANMTYGIGDTCALFYENGTYDQLFIIGGANSTIDSGARGSTPYVQIYNITDDSWHEGAIMTEWRAWMCPVLIDDDIYVVGGANYTVGGGVVPADDMYIYDIVANSWSSGSVFPRNIYRYAALNINDKLYTFGGVKQDHIWLPNQTIRMVWEYDPVGDSWDYIHIGINRTWGAVAMLSDGIHYFAGDKESAAGDVYIQTDDHFIINGTSNATWESATQIMPTDDYLFSLTLTHTVTTDAYVDEVWAEVSGVEKARWSTDLTSGSSTLLNAASLTTGDLYGVDGDFALVVVLRSEGDSTPSITQIDGITVGYLYDFAFTWNNLGKNRKSPTLTVAGYRSDAEQVVLQVWRVDMWYTLDMSVVPQSAVAAKVYTLSPSDVAARILQIRFTDTLGDAIQSTVYLDLLEYEADEENNPPAAPIDVFIDIDYDMWANEILVKVWWVQTGGPEPAVEDSSWVTLEVDGHHLGVYEIEDDTQHIAAPWSWWGGDNHNISGTGSVVVNWSWLQKTQTYYSDPVFEYISNFARWVAVMFFVFCIFCSVLILVVKRVKDRRSEVSE